MLAVIAMGAAIVPVSKSTFLRLQNIEPTQIVVTLPVEEAAYFVTKSKQVAILTAPSSSKLGQDVSSYVKSQHSQNVEIIPILPNLPWKSMDHDSIVISSNQYLSDNSAGIIIFTSGTTGPPKGAVMRRRFLSTVLSQ